MLTLRVDVLLCMYRPSIDAIIHDEETAF
jgi:hypothetical protein